MLQFSIRGLLLISVPIAFGFLWLADYYREPDPIQWRNFNVEEMNAELGGGKSVLVVALPQTVKVLCISVMKQFDTTKIKRHCHDAGYATMKFQYTPWTPCPDHIRDENNWLLEIVHGAYKEPALLIVSPDGSVKTLQSICFQPIGGFFDEQPVPRWHARDFYLLGAVLSLVVAVFVSVRTGCARSLDSD